MVTGLLHDLWNYLLFRSVVWGVQLDCSVESVSRNRAILILHCIRTFYCCLQAKHTQEGSQTWGVNGETGALADMKELGIWEPLSVKLQTYKTAVEVRETTSLIPWKPKVFTTLPKEVCGKKWV